MKRDPKLWAALSYALGLLSGAIVLAVEKDDLYVRFHAMQSVLTFAAIAFLYVLLPTVPLVGDLPPVRAAFSISVFFFVGPVNRQGADGGGLSPSVHRRCGARDVRQQVESDYGPVRVPDS